MVQLFLQRYGQQDFLGVSHDAICCTYVAKVKLDSTSATVALNVARLRVARLKVEPCVRDLSVKIWRKKHRPGYKV